LNKLLGSKKARQPKIGSVKNDKINYDKEEQFFSKDDIPLYARTIKEEINNLIDPDHLGLRKKNWNASVSVPKSFEKEETHEQKLLKVEYKQFRSSWVSRITLFLSIKSKLFIQELIQGTITRNGT